MLTANTIKPFTPWCCGIYCWLEIVIWFGYCLLSLGDHTIHNTRKHPFHSLFVQQLIHFLLRWSTGRAKQNLRETTDPVLNQGALRAVSITEKSSFIM